MVEIEEERKVAVLRALDSTSSECCKFNHHWVWAHGAELPFCPEARRESLLGCAHGENLKLRAAVALLADMDVIDGTSLLQLLTFLNGVRDSLWVLDLTAIEATTNSDPALREGAIRGLGADPSNLHTLEVTFETEQMEVISSLTLLRSCILKALDPMTPDPTPLRSFLRQLVRFNDSLCAFQPNFRQFVASVRDAAE